jgi:hypothetical protein
VEEEGAKPVISSSPSNLSQELTEAVHKDWKCSVDLTGILDITSDAVQEN